ncbi:hypothetical protein Tco_1136236 [Tanacetum coccineum]
MEGTAEQSTRITDEGNEQTRAVRNCYPLYKIADLSTSCKGRVFIQDRSEVRVSQLRVRKKTFPILHLRIDTVTITSKSCFCLTMHGRALGPFERVCRSLSLLKKGRIVRQVLYVVNSDLQDSSFSNVKAESCAVHLILAYLRKMREEFIAFCDCFKEGFGRCVDAKRQSVRSKDIGGPICMEPMHCVDFTSLVLGEVLGQVQLTGLELVQETTERIIQIKQRIQTARDRQKSYADLKRKPMEFQVGDKVMLKIEASSSAERVHNTVSCIQLDRNVILRSISHTLEVSNVDDKLHFVEELYEIMIVEVKTIEAKPMSLFSRFAGTLGEVMSLHGNREDRFRKNRKYPTLVTKGSHLQQKPICGSYENHEYRGERIIEELVKVENSHENALVAQDRIGGYDWSYQAEEDQVSVKFKTRLGYNADASTAASPAVESFVNSSKMLENQEYNKSKSDKGYH